MDESRPIESIRAVPRIARDGSKVEITFESAIGEKAIVFIDRPKLGNLIQLLMKMFELAQANAAATSDHESKPQALEQPPLLFHVEDLTLTVHPESDATTIRMKTIEGRELQVEFHPQHLQFLIDSIRRSGSLPQPPGVH